LKLNDANIIKFSFIKTFTIESNKLVVIKSNKVKCAISIK